MKANIQLFSGCIKKEQRLACASGGYTRNLHSANKYSTVAYYRTFF